MCNSECVSLVCACSFGRQNPVPNEKFTSSAGNLTFYTGSANTPVYNVTNNCMTYQNTSKAPVVIFEGNVRRDAPNNEFVGSSFLPRPSTSWDANYTGTLVMQTGTSRVTQVVVSSAASTSRRWATLPAQACSIDAVTPLLVTNTALAPVSYESDLDYV